MKPTGEQLPPASPSTDVSGEAQTWWLCSVSAQACVRAAGDPRRGPGWGSTQEASAEWRQVAVVMLGQCERTVALLEAPPLGGLAWDLGTDSPRGGAATQGCPAGGGGGAVLSGGGCLQGGVVAEKWGHPSWKL